MSAMVMTALGVGSITWALQRVRAHRRLTSRATGAGEAVSAASRPG